MSLPLWSFCLSAKGSKSTSKVMGELASLEPPLFFLGRKAFHHGVLSVIFDCREGTGTGNTCRHGGAVVIAVPQEAGAAVSILRTSQVSRRLASPTSLHIDVSPVALVQRRIDTFIKERLSFTESAGFRLRNSPLGVPVLTPDWMNAQGLSPWNNRLSRGVPALEREQEGSQSDR
ncbi:hypothetical protein EYF80_001738 [Liparis tanakae]|uniref:Uncharacterized protein n=1 Tax=Liparis tanakae TaxID=230148 RepID=A0A4Z2JDV2_9TELE|nr:hypothetical protein EYF80_001738 [Liparis tanakae]